MSQNIYKTILKPYYVFGILLIIFAPTICHIQGFYYKFLIKNPTFKQMIDKIKLHAFLLQSIIQMLTFYLCTFPEPRLSSRNSFTIFRNNNCDH